MTDTVSPVAPLRRQADTQTSIASTTAIALGTSGGAGIVLWVIDCLAAEKLIIPDREVCMFLAACLAPIVHAVGRIILYHLGRFDGPNN